MLDGGAYLYGLWPGAGRAASPLAHSGVGAVLCLGGHCCLATVAMAFLRPGLPALFEFLAVDGLAGF